jgi:hypothetical protein
LEEKEPMVKRVGFLALFWLISGPLFAQSAPAAEGRGLSVWAGGEFSTFNPDYGCASASPFSCGNAQLFGIGAYGDANHLVKNLGGEAEARWLHWRGPIAGFHQSTYLFGPRYEALRYRKLSTYVKVLIGDAQITVPGATIGTGSYLAYAPGATFEYALTHRLSARADYEYQVWPSFKGDFNGTGGLTPNGFSFGVSYQVLHRVR